MKLAFSFRQSVAFCALVLTLTLVAFGLTSLVLETNANRTNSQSQEKIIEKMTYPKEPFEITDIKIKGKEIKAGEKFENSEDTWLKDVEFKITNRLDKPIIFFLLTLRFSDPASNTQPIAYDIYVGQRPKATRHASGPIFLIKNDSANIKLSDTEYEKVKRYLLNSGRTVNNTTKVSISIAAVIFNDGTEWQFGTFYEPDPSSPRGLREVKN